MKTKTTTLRKKLSRYSLDLNIQRFFKTTDFKSHYIYILAKLTTDAGKNNFILGNKMLIDVRNTAEVQAFRTAVVISFNKISHSNKAVQSDILTLNYVETDKATYDKYVTETAKAENFNLDTFI